MREIVQEWVNKGESATLEDVQDALDKTGKIRRSSKSKAQSFKEIGEFWDTHDIAEHWEDTKPAEFEVDIKSEVTYYAVDNKLSAMVQEFAKSHGVSPDKLLNLWLQEKLQEQNS